MVVMNKLLRYILNNPNFNILKNEMRNKLRKENQYEDH